MSKVAVMSSVEFNSGRLDSIFVMDKKKYDILQKIKKQIDCGSYSGRYSQCLIESSDIVIIENDYLAKPIIEFDFSIGVNPLCHSFLNDYGMSVNEVLDEIIAFDTNDKVVFTSKISSNYFYQKLYDIFTFKNSKSDENCFLLVDKNNSTCEWCNKNKIDDLI